MKYWRKQCKWICKQLEQQTLKYVYLWEKRDKVSLDQFISLMEFLHPDKSNAHMYLKC